MADVQKADPGARRQAVWLLVAGTVAGALLIVAFARYETPLVKWMRADPREAAHRLTLVLVAGVVVLSAPAVLFAAYLWRLGGRVLRAQQFPPPGYRAIRDIPIVTGRAAVLRGQLFRILGACLGVASLFLWLTLWRLARLLAVGPPT
jgi:hypothetical protein